MPHFKRAELIDGIVYMPSPVKLGHGDSDGFLDGWLSCYAIATPGFRPNANGTWLMGKSQVPQPDVTLRVLPDLGGQSKVEGK